MQLQDQFPTLPVGEVIPSIKQELSQYNTVLVQAPPGAGKSTLLPLCLLDEPWLGGKKILMLEPRRLAASSIAYRMAEMLGEQIGNRIGYRIRFESKVSANTQLEVITEGILTRRLQHDNALEEVGLVIFDEFHERNLHSDLGLALCREVQGILRPDIKILIMSATLDADPLAELLHAPVVKSTGKLYPVDLIYTGDTVPHMIAESCAHTVLKALNEQDGDILVFLPGQGEIKKTASLLSGKATGCIIHQLFGALPHAKQQAAIRPDRSGKRKIVLATNIAETSLTIEGIRVVVDSGYTRSSKFDPNTAMSSLATLPVTLDAADQRAGRAGRLSEGVCYRMWSKSSQLQRQPYRVPEIAEADLSGLMLELAKWGTVDPKSLTWLTPPPQGHVLQAMQLLEELGALDRGRITPHGIQMYRLPCHPRIAHMLIISQELNLGSLACDIAAILEEKDSLAEAEGVSILLRLDILHRFRQKSVASRALEKLEKTSASYRKTLKVEPFEGIVDPYATGLLIAHAYPERIASARPGNGAQFQLANGSIAAIGHKDELAHAPWLAVAHLDGRDRMGKIFLAAELDPTDLRPWVKRREKIQWSEDRGSVIAEEEWRLGQIVLKSTPIANADPKRIAEALLEAVRTRGEQLLEFSQDILQLQNRVNSLRVWNPEMGLPDMHSEHLLATAKDWLLPYLTGVKTRQDLKKLDLEQIFRYSLLVNHNLDIDRLAPAALQVPTGSWIKLEYRKDGEQPVLAVRLQELFGMTATPTINDGRMPILIHLLSPGFKPVQITSDLRSFWNQAYHEVRNELKRRYPKHYWPENPLEAEPVRGVKRKQ